MNPIRHYNINAQVSNTQLERDVERMAETQKHVDAWDRGWAAVLYVVGGIVVGLLLSGAV
jgi:hypothetical protein